MNNYKTETYRDATKFGGVIYASDFETDFRRKDELHGSPIAQRIMRDWRFDEQCHKNCISRDMRNKTKKQNNSAKENDNV